MYSGSSHLHFKIVNRAALSHHGFSSVEAYTKYKSLKRNAVGMSGPLVTRKDT